MNCKPASRAVSAWVWGCLTAAAAVGASAAAEPTLIASGHADRQRVDVTVYNMDLALVREVRKIDLPRGDFVLEFQDVPALINPVTLLVAADPGAGLTLLEQNYEFDLMSKDKILQKYVGRPVAWIQEDGSRLEGTLLGMAAGPVFAVDGEIQFEVPGRIVLPEMPENLRARPTLVWLAHTDRGGPAQVETSYLTGGFSWHADYVLQLDEAGARAGLQAWVTVENGTGASFRQAQLLLVAGDVNRVAPPVEKFADAMMTMRAGAAEGFTEEALYDYHMYTLQRPTDLNDQQIKQISLFEAAGLNVAKHYRLQAQPYYFREGGPLAVDQKVEVSYSFLNSKSNQLGMPLPAGVFRVYGRSQSGARQLLGEDRIDHTPKDELVSLKVGKAFDIVAERVRTDSRKITDNLFRSSHKITLRNHRTQDVVVEVVEPVGGFWTLVESSLPHRKISAQELAFDVPVPAEGQTVLTYTVEVQY